MKIEYVFVLIAVLGGVTICILGFLSLSGKRKTRDKEKGAQSLSALAGRLGTLRKHAENEAVRLQTRKRVEKEVTVIENQIASRFFNSSNRPIKFARAHETLDNLQMYIDADLGITRNESMPLPAELLRKHHNHG